MWLLYVLLASTLFVVPGKASKDFPWNCTELPQPCSTYSTTLTPGDASGFYILNTRNDTLVNLTIVPLTNTNNDYIFYLYRTQVCPKPGDEIPFEGGNIAASPGQKADYAVIKMPPDSSTYFFVLMSCNNLFQNCNDKFQVCIKYYSQ